LSVGSEEFEKQILDIVSGLGEALRIRTHATRIIWVGRQVSSPSFMKGLGSDYCDFDGRDVILPSSLKGKLSPVDWKPLLASQQIYERRSNIAILIRWIGVMTAFVITWLLEVSLLLNAYGDYGLAIALGLVIPTAALTTWWFSHELRNVRLAADEKAAQVIGPGEFLRVLEKIDTFKLSDIEERKRRGFRVRISSHVPPLDDRIGRVRKLMQE